MNETLEDIKLFEEQLWQLCERNAEGMTAQEAIQALKSITSHIYSGGIDEAWDKTPFKNMDNLCEVWNIIWLSSFARRLKKYQQRKGATDCKEGV